MNIYDFLDYCIDAGLMTVEIYRCSTGENVWTGDGDEVPEEFGYCELASFDVPTKADHITLNIE